MEPLNKLSVKNENNNDRSILQAVENGCINNIKIMLRDGKNINEQNWQGNTLLHLSVRANQSSLASFLIEAGANKDITNHMGLTPLHMACLKGDVALVKLLVHSGSNTKIKAKLNERSALDYTPLHMSLIKGHKEISKLLIKRSLFSSDDEMAVADKSLTESIINHSLERHIKKNVSKLIIPSYFRHTAESTESSFFQETLMIKEN